ncbi:MAG: DnaJ domain-containing protein [Candidatus Thorarchaeota archaeon]
MEKIRIKNYLLNYYVILGVDKYASKEEIRKAYKKIAKKHHPDKNNGKESEEFINAKKAYDILSDDAKRIEYDANGKIEEVKNEATQVLDLIIETFDFVFNELYKFYERDKKERDIIEYCKEWLKDAIIKHEQEIEEFKRKLEYIEKIERSVVNDNKNKTKTMEFVFNHKKQSLNFAIYDTKNKIEITKKAYNVINK